MMNRENPYVPLALVWQLANQTATRRSLTGDNYAHIVLTKGQMSNMTGIRINDTTGPDFDAFVGRALEGVTRMGPDTATILYATQPSNVLEIGQMNVKEDYGLILRPHEPPFGIAWQYAPEFQMTLLNEKAMEEIGKGVGMAEVQQLLDRLNPKS